ncbi:MAG: hypothetical protein QOJ28_3351, partial [Mycobacterium sp.]|nr:hypothetical protein [Mycobacterium sp.]
MRQTIDSAKSGATAQASDIGRDSVALLDGSCRLSREAVCNKAHGINLMRGLGLPVPP